MPGAPAPEPAMPKQPEAPKPATPKQPEAPKATPPKPTPPSAAPKSCAKPSAPPSKTLPPDAILELSPEEKKAYAGFWSKYKPPSSAYSPTSPASTPVASPAEPSPKASAGTIVTPECKKRLELTPEGLDVFQLHPFLVVHLYVYAFVNVYVYVYAHMFLVYMRVISSISKYVCIYTYLHTVACVRTLPKHIFGIRAHIFWPGHTGEKTERQIGIVLQCCMQHVLSSSTTYDCIPNENRPGQRFSGRALP